MNGCDDIYILLQHIKSYILLLFCTQIVAWYLDSRYYSCDLCQRIFHFGFICYCCAMHTSLSSTPLTSRTQCVLRIQYIRSVEWNIQQNSTLFLCRIYVSDCWLHSRCSHFVPKIHSTKYFCGFIDFSLFCWSIYIRIRWTKWKF